MADVKTTLPSLNELFAKCRNKEEGAQLYAVFLSQYGDRADWKSINQAVIDRWSLSGLTDVKDMAWERLEP